MYVKISRSFLEQLKNDELKFFFPFASHSSNTPRRQIIQDILAFSEHDPSIGACQTYFGICPFCRNTILLVASNKVQAKPRFCMTCGKTSPIDAFFRNQEKTNQLMILVSKMNRKVEQTTKTTLLEQALVSSMTGVEVMLREVYSLIYDLRHVVIGSPVFADTYNRTRNEFLNLGSATRHLRQVTQVDLKTEFEPTEYAFLSRLYSTRHVIIHNSGMKDRDYISQTGESESQINKPVVLKIAELSRLSATTRKIARVLDSQLRVAVFSYLSSLARARAPSDSRRKFLDKIEGPDAADLHGIHFRIISCGVFR
jgi:hypothetical protein